jgi:hypothetical protein
MCSTDSGYISLRTASKEFPYEEIPQDLFLHFPE